MKNTFLVVTSYKAALIDLYLNTRASSDIRHTPGRWFLLLSPYWDNGHHTSDHGCLTNRLFSQTPSDIFSSLHSFKCCFEAGRQAGRGGGGKKAAWQPLHAVWCRMHCSVHLSWQKCHSQFVLSQNRAIWTFFSFFQPHSLHRKHAKVGGKRTNYHCAQLPTLPAMEENSVCVLCC